MSVSVSVRAYARVAEKVGYVGRTNLWGSAAAFLKMEGIADLITDLVLLTCGANGGKTNLLRFSHCSRACARAATD